MRIVSIDPGLRNFGYAIFENGKLIGYEGGIFITPEMAMDISDLISIRLNKNYGVWLTLESSFAENYNPITKKATTFISTFKRIAKENDNCWVWGNRY